MFFNEFKTTSQWKSFLNRKQTLRKTYLNNIDKELIDSIQILHDVDQYQYCLIPSGRVELQDAFKKTVFLDSLLEKLIVNKGFPSEKLIGANFRENTSINPLPSYYTLLRHSYQANSDMIEVHLKNAIQNGNLKQDVYSNISDVNKMEYVVVECKVYKRKSIDNNYNPTKEQELIRKKIIYNNSNNQDGFIFFAPLSFLEGVSINNFFGGNYSEFYEYFIDYSKCN